MASGPKVRAAQPSATWSSTTRLCMSFASCLMCSIMARSVGVPSKVTRMVLYMRQLFGLSAFDNLPSLFHGVRQTVKVKGRDCQCRTPAGDEQKPPEPPLSHPLAGTGEVQQGEHRK